jgi:hypothetical protein
MKVYYYHLRNKGIITSTVAFAWNGDRFCRGVAVVSPSDNPCKATGRKVALARLHAAVASQKNVPFRNDKNGTNIPGFSCKIGYGVVLTGYEKKIVG